MTTIATNPTPNPPGSPADAEDDELKHLRCTEVWGGFETVDRPLRMPGLDGRVFSRPFRGPAGGDVHYVSSCGTGLYSRLLLADVAGHGKQVASTAARLRKLMRRHIASHSQSGLVRAVNREFAAVTDAGTFATAVVMTYNSRRRRLVVSNAGHPPPLLYRADAGAWSYLAPAAAPGTDVSLMMDLPLGIEPTTEYQEFEEFLAPGDVVVCYTDWLTEARDGAGEMLGFDGLLDFARALPPGGPEEMVRGLLAAVTRRASRPVEGEEPVEPGEVPDHDDVTLLLFRATGKPQKPTVATNLLAPFRVLRAVAGSYLPGPQATGP